MKVTISMTDHHQMMVGRAADNAGAGEPPAAHRSALPVPDDPLDAVLGHLDGLAMHGNGCAWFNDVDFATLENDIAGDFHETLDALPETTVVSDAGDAGTPERAEPVSKPGRPVAMPPPPPPPPSSDSSSSSSEDDDDGDPWLPPKSTKRFRGATGERRPRQKQQTGQLKRTRAFTIQSPAPARAVVAAEDGGGGGDEKCWCRHCGSTQTMQWRTGPEGAKTLCNACGLRWSKLVASGKRRPAAKASCAKSKNYPALPATGDDGGKVVRKQRSVTIYID
ncbi:hypothetical protein ACP70R_039819 [Stipagrostis hirtigluma subsp. patula]